MRRPRSDKGNGVGEDQCAFPPAGAGIGNEEKSRKAVRWLAAATEPRLAIVMGTEGEGLPLATIAETDYVVRIPMAHGVDSLNVAAAAAVAFWQLRAPEITEN